MTLLRSPAWAGYVQPWWHGAATARRPTRPRSPSQSPSQAPGASVRRLRWARSVRKEVFHPPQARPLQRHAWRCVNDAFKLCRIVPSPLSMTAHWHPPKQWPGSCRQASSSIIQQNGPAVARRRPRSRWPRNCRIPEKPCSLAATPDPASAVGLGSTRPDCRQQPCTLKMHNHGHHQRQDLLG